MVSAKKVIALNQPQARVMLLAAIYFVAALTVRRLLDQSS